MFTPINERNIIYQFDGIDFEDDSEENRKRVRALIYNNNNYYYYNYYYYNYNYYYYYYYNYYYYNYNYYSIQELQIVICTLSYFQDQMDKILSNDTNKTTYEID